MACDMRVISEKAKLGFTFVKLGLHPGVGFHLEESPELALIIQFIQSLCIHPLTHVFIRLPTRYGCHAFYSHSRRIRDRLSLAADWRCHQWPRGEGASAVHANCPGRRFLRSGRHGAGCPRGQPGTDRSAVDSLLSSRQTGQRLGPGTAQVRTHEYLFDYQVWGGVPSTVEGCN